MRLLSLFLFSMLSAVVCAADSSTKVSENSDVSHQASAVKQSVLELNRQLYQLEKDLLNPATTRAALYVSLTGGDFFELHSVHVTIDAKRPIEYLYTKRQLAALRQGAIHPLATLNLGPGLHSVKVTAKGKDFQGLAAELTIEKQVEKNQQPLFIELTLVDNKETKTAALTVSQWQ